MMLCFINVFIDIDIIHKYSIDWWLYGNITERCVYDLSKMTLVILK